jgi:hypothetical protein
MNTRLSEIERMMQDKTLPHSDQQLLDQELDELRAIGDFLEPEPLRSCVKCNLEPGSAGMGNVCADYPSASHLCIDCGSMDQLNHIEHRGKIIVRCDDCERGCPCCDGRCADCGRTGHMNYGTRDGMEATLCDVCVDAEEDTRGCGNCAGCAYCISFGEYDHAGEV